MNCSEGKRRRIDAQRRVMPEEGEEKTIIINDILEEQYAKLMKNSTAERNRIISIFDEEKSYFGRIMPQKEFEKVTNKRKRFLLKVTLGFCVLLLLQMPINML